MLSESWSAENWFHAKSDWQISSDLHSMYIKHTYSSMPKEVVRVIFFQKSQIFKVRPSTCQSLWIGNAHQGVWFFLQLWSPVKTLLVFSPTAHKVIRASTFTSRILHCCPGSGYSLIQQSDIHFVTLDNTMHQHSLKTCHWKKKSTFISTQFISLYYFPICLKIFSALSLR